jgi:micrococcal nuclease
MKPTLCFLMLALAGCTAAASSYPAVSISSCYDGDTCRTTTGEKIRLACIDTPELRGRNADPIPAKASRDYLRSFIAGKTITIRRITTDRYGRTVAELFADGVSTSKQLVDTGLDQIRA